MQSIRANQELALKLTEKSTTIMDFISKATVLIDSDRMPANPDELETVVKKFDILQIEQGDLQVCSKMVTDWSTEISRGPNPSRSVDQAESLISEQLAITSRGIKSKRQIYQSLYDTWLLLDETFKCMEIRADNITKMSENVTNEPDNQVFINQLDDYINEEQITNELAQIKDLNNVFLDGQIMTEFLEERIKSVLLAITKATDTAKTVKKSAEDNIDKGEIEKVDKWVEETELIVQNAQTVEQLQSISDQLQQYANVMNSEENIQEKLTHLDLRIRDRRQEIGEVNVVTTEINNHLAVLGDMKEKKLSACDRPAEYQVAQNTLDGAQERHRSLDVYKLLYDLADELKLPHGTDDRVTIVRTKLEAAEFDLSSTEVHTVSLTGDTIEEARNSVIRIYQDLVEVKTNLEGLIKTKRELQRHNFIEPEETFSVNLVGLRERFNAVGDRITQNKATLSKSLRRVQKLKRAVDETDQWATEVLNHGVNQYPMETRLKMASDAETRRREVREATEDCISKISNQLSANTDSLEEDVSHGLQATEKLITAMRNEEAGSSTDISSVSSSGSSSDSSSSSSSSSDDSSSDDSSTDKIDDEIIVKPQKVKSAVHVDSLECF